MPSNSQSTSFCNIIPWSSLFATTIAIIGCIIFCLSFGDGIDGFFKQINTLASISTNDVNTIIRSILLKICFIFVGSCLLFFVISVFATSALALTTTTNPNNFQHDRRPFYHRFLSSRKTIAVSILFAHTILIIWLLILCSCAMVLILYVVFFAITTQFCALLDTKCFDLKILYPVIKRITSNKVDLVVCQEKKEAICEANHLGSFIIAFICCIIALIGLIHFLMCMSANYARLSTRQAIKKGKHYAMNTGTVDSDSIIVQTMGK
uniref:Uncharacterized protein n=1 Tax=Panagrolaimus sp. JU765 TaxID=591449 RepID=A0AC34RSG0_9BILA